MIYTKANDSRHRKRNYDTANEQQLKEVSRI